MKTAQRCSISRQDRYLLQPSSSFAWHDKELIALHLPAGSAERAKRATGHYLSTTEPEHVNSLIWIQYLPLNWRGLHLALCS